jgi:cobalt-zinc-cadmium efflux system protein
MAAHDHGRAGDEGHAHPGAHGHETGPAAGHAGLGLALALTLGYAVVELAAGHWFGSLALISDAGHMVSDAAALAVAWFAAWLGQRPPGARHSFGLARAEVIAAFVNGLALLLVVVWIVVEAVRRLQSPSPVHGPGVIAIALAGLVINVGVAYVLSRSEPSLNRRAALLHVLSDVAGSVAALAAGAVVTFTGWRPIDPILSLAIAGLILLSTFGLLRDALHVLMEGVPRSLRLEEVGRALARVAEVRDVHDLHIWQISSGRVALSAHLRVASLERWPQILDDARAVLAQRFGIEHVTLQPELGGANGGEPPAVIRLVRR